MGFEWSTLFEMVLNRIGFSKLILTEIDFANFWSFENDKFFFSKTSENSMGCFNLKRVWETNKQYEWVTEITNMEDKMEISWKVLLAIRIMDVLLSSGEGSSNTSFNDFYAYSFSTWVTLLTIVHIIPTEHTLFHVKLTYAKMTKTWLS